MIILVGGSLGYTGVFIVTLLISLIVFVPVLYIPVLIIALVSGRFDPSLLAFVSAIGVTLGKMSIFLASNQGRSLIKKETLTRMTPLQLLLAKYGSLGSFVVSLIPFLPDDYHYTPWHLQICSMEIFLNNFPWKVYSQFDCVMYSSILGVCHCHPTARQNYRSFVLGLDCNS